MPSIYHGPDAGLPGWPSSGSPGTSESLTHIQVISLLIPTWTLPQDLPSTPLDHFLPEFGDAHCDLWVTYYVLGTGDNTENTARNKILKSLNITELMAAW